MSFHKWRRLPTKHFGEVWVPLAHIQLQDTDGKLHEAVALVFQTLNGVQEPSRFRAPRLRRLTYEVDRPHGIVAHAEPVVMTTQVQVTRRAPFARRLFPGTDFFHDIQGFAAPYKSLRQPRLASPHGRYIKCTRAGCNGLANQLSHGPTQESPCQTATQPVAPAGLYAAARHTPSGPEAEPVG